jgi:prepilin-type N-terminal cleavage/methylation domain-containing protein
MKRWTAARGQGGFTLAEMLVATAIIAIVLGGMLSLLMSGTQTWTTGANRTEAQQNARLVLQQMAQEVRNGGWDPQATSSFPSIQALPPGQTGFIISNDWNATGAIEIAAPVNVNGVNRGEQITYDFVGTALRRREVPVDGAVVNITNAITNITFTYRDADDNVVVNPHLIGTAPSIRTVEITVTTRQDQAGSYANNVSITTTLRARVRNRS